MNEYDEITQRAIERLAARGALPRPLWWTVKYPRLLRVVQRVPRWRPIPLPDGPTSAEAIRAYERPFREAYERRLGEHPPGEDVR